MARIVEPLEIADVKGVKTGRWRAVEHGTSTNIIHQLCDCQGGHESPSAAMQCAQVRREIGEGEKTAGVCPTCGRGGWHGG